MRTVEVLYLVPVYATVDLDAPDPAGSKFYDDEAIVEVIADESSIMLVDDAVFAFSEAPSVQPHQWRDDAARAITTEDVKRAIAIAENTTWPVWERV